MLSTIVAEGNISNFERSEKYIDCSFASKYRVAKQHIDIPKVLVSSCEATYRHTEGIGIELRSNISAKEDDLWKIKTSYARTL